MPQIQVICDYLLRESIGDGYLGSRIMSKGKTIDNMYKFILTAVKTKFKDQIQNSGVMVKDEDVFNLAIHYFIESDEALQAEYPHTVTKAEVKGNTKPAEEIKPKVVKPDKVEDEQLSLFDFGVEV